MKANCLKIVIALCIIWVKGFSETEIMYIKPTYIGCSPQEVDWVTRLESEELGRYWYRGFYYNELFFTEIKNGWKNSGLADIKNLKEKNVKYFVHQTITKEGDNYVIDFKVEDISQNIDGIVIGVFRGPQERFKKWFQLSIVCNIISLSKGNNPSLKHTINIGRMSKGSSNIYKVSWWIEEELLSADINNSKLTDNFYIILYSKETVEDEVVYKKINGELNSGSTEIQIRYNEKRIAPKIKLGSTTDEKLKCIQDITKKIIAELQND